jgi:hypothetical protein
MWIIFEYAVTPEAVEALTSFMSDFQRASCSRFTRDSCKLITDVSLAA